MSEEPLSKNRRIYTETIKLNLSEDGSAITIIGKGRWKIMMNIHHHLGLKIVRELPSSLCLKTLLLLVIMHFLDVLITLLNSVTSISQ